MTQTEFPGFFPEIATERLLLRRIMRDDAQAVFRNFSDPEVARWFLKQPLTKIEQTTEFIEQFDSDFREGKGLTWAVTLMETGEFIGTC